MQLHFCARCVLCALTLLTSAYACNDLMCRSRKKERCKGVEQEENVGVLVLLLLARGGSRGKKGSPPNAQHTFPNRKSTGAARKKGWPPLRQRSPGAMFRMRYCRGGGPVAVGRKGRPPRTKRSSGRTIHDATRTAGVPELWEERAGPQARLVGRGRPFLPTTSGQRWALLRCPGAVGSKGRPPRTKRSSGRTIE